MKTSLVASTINDFLVTQFETIDDLQNMIEGEESQAFSFRYEDNKYVIRINPSIDGFKKDEYAYKHFTSASVPIPKVIMVGQIDSNHAFCISEMAEGITFQDADEVTISRLLQPVTEVWQAISRTDLATTSGYGDFGSNGRGQFASWREYLLSILDDKKYNWSKLISLMDVDLVKQMSDEFARLVPECPEERNLVHGDFGSNNLLVSNNAVTSVLDWENALYGDPLFDIAGAYFWRTWLLCMEKSAGYWEKSLSDVPNYHKRIRCYQLRAGLHEIYDNAQDNDHKMLEWLQHRCKEILGEK